MFDAMQEGQGRFGLPALGSGVGFAVIVALKIGLKLAATAGSGLDLHDDVVTLDLTAPVPTFEVDGRQIPITDERALNGLEDGDVDVLHVIANGPLDPMLGGIRGIAAKNHVRLDVEYR